MKYTAEEVREAARITDGMPGLRKLSDMLTAHADMPDEVRELAEEVIEAINDGDAQSARNAAQAALDKYNHQEPRA